MTSHGLIKKDYGESFQEHLLEQYKLFVHTSLDVTSKRLESNKFHLALNSVVFGLAGYMTTIEEYLVIVLLSLVGVLISLVWLKNICAYRELNSAKFKVIHELEEHLPASLFKCEEEHYLRKYHGLTSTEKFYPLIFSVLYIVLIIICSVNLPAYSQLAS